MFTTPGIAAVMNAHGGGDPATRERAPARNQAAHNLATIWWP